MDALRIAPDRVHVADVVDGEWFHPYVGLLEFFNGLAFGDRLEKWESGYWKQHLTLCDCGHIFNELVRLSLFFISF